MNWDGEHIDGMSNDDAMVLTDLRPSQAKPPNAGCPCVAPPHETPVVVRRALPGFAR
jgi:hypothetical protein